MSDTYRHLLEVLSRHFSSILAKSVLDRALVRARVNRERLSPSQLPALVDEIKAGGRLFVAPERLAQLEVELSALLDDVEPPRAEVIRVNRELDVSTARMAARRLAEALGCGALTAQKVATVVSELARNIVNYTGGGEILLEPISEPRPGVHVRASDSGPGIPNIDEIMSGKYRSKTGLGLGLQGTRRLATHFNIKTGGTGTIIDVEICR